MKKTRERIHRTLPSVFRNGEIIAARDVGDKFFLYVEFEAPDGGRPLLFELAQCHLQRCGEASDGHARINQDRLYEVTEFADSAK
jgi:hypothetical protein